MKKFLSIMFLCLVIAPVFSQSQKKLIQFSGVVLSSDTLEPVPFVSVYDKSLRRATFGDYSGFYSMVVQTGDTILFLSTGYKKAAYIIPDTLTGNRYTMVQLLSPDTIYLKELSVRPWPSREQFAQAFMDLELPRTAYDRYNENVTLADLKMSNTDFGDALSCYDAQMGKEYSRLYSQGQIPTLNLLSPSAWRSFIKTWKAGGFKRQ